MIFFLNLRTCIQIGDIPDADIKPPDNVLFVCKLNPVTEVSSSLLTARGCIYPFY